MKNKISIALIFSLFLPVLITCEKILEPKLNIAPITKITYSAAVSGGTITNGGGAPISARGVCWSTIQNPTIDNFKTYDGADIGNYVSTIAGLAPGTIYYIRAYATNSLGTGYSRQETFKTMSINKPSLNTASVTAITSTSAMCGGNITDDGGANVISRGVCWNTTVNPTTANLKTSNGTGSGTFNSALTGLSSGTTYYVRAYATNSSGTSYGNETSFITQTPSPNPLVDVDGNTYNYITIGTQVWMKENLKTTRFKDGSPIPNVATDVSWSTLNTPGYCWYGNNLTNKDIYGALYNWYAVKTGNLCPTGWHVPSIEEWSILENYLISNGYNYDGTTSDSKIAKSLSLVGNWWPSTNIGAVGNNDYPEKRNLTGFSALPAGFRITDGRFLGVGEVGYWWSVTESSSSNAQGRHISYLGRALGSHSVGKQNGESLRCLKD